MSACEVVLSYEGGRWRARGAGLDLVHGELRGLEALIEARFATDQAPIDVQLKFDTAALPRWLQQYHGHYCNYTLHVPTRGRPA